MKTTCAMGLMLAVLAALNFACEWRGDSDRSTTVMVSAAASTTDAMRQAAKAFEQQTGMAVVLNFASSGQLARQIVDGAPVDLYISANPKWMDFLAARKRISVDTRTDLLSNELVLIVPAGRGLVPEPPQILTADYDLPNRISHRLAIGDPSYVPAGTYAASALKSLGWFDAMSDRLVPCKDVRSALAFVERGEVDAAIVYSTDAAASDKVREVSRFPAHTHPPIRYPVALTQRGQSNVAASSFYSFLHGYRAAEIFRSHGFSVVSSGGSDCATGVSQLR